MANIARAIWREWGEDHADTVSITAPPICPKCGELERFIQQIATDNSGYLTHYRDERHSVSTAQFLYYC